MVQQVIFLMNYHVYEKYKVYNEAQPTHKVDELITDILHSMRGFYGFLSRFTYFHLKKDKDKSQINLPVLDCPENKRCIKSF